VWEKNGGWQGLVKKRDWFSDGQGQGTQGPTSKENRCVYDIIKKIADGVWGKLVTNEVHGNGLRRLTTKEKG